MTLFVLIVAAAAVAGDLPDRSNPFRAEASRLAGGGMPISLADALTVCLAPDNGTGTADLPAPCAYTTPSDDMRIVDGLPPGTTIEIDGSIDGYTGQVEAPGGSLGGHVQTYDAKLAMPMVGTGMLAGYNRLLSMPITCQTHSGPRTPGSLLQSFPTDFFQMQGQLPPGDPDFDLLRISAGTGFGMPSPGHTTLTSQGGGTWAVESFFDITYRIDFVGAPGGPLAGMSGSTTATIRIQQGEPDIWQPGDGHKMHFPQLPNDAGWDVRATHSMLVADDWRCSETGWVKDIHFWGSWRGGLRGNIDSFNVSIYSDVPAGVDLPYSHPGTRLWYGGIRNYVETAINPPVFGGWYDPRVGLIISNDHLQYFQYDILLDTAQWFYQNIDTIYWLCISAAVPDTIFGLEWGWRSSLDRFNDDGVWISMIGTECVAPDNGGTVAPLPANCPYTTPYGDMQIIDGLPPGTTIEIDGSMGSYFGQSEVPGGALGGHQQSYGAVLDLPMQGTGMLAGYTRNINMVVNCGTISGPRTPGTSPQSFPTDFLQMQGQLPPGDPDFDLLRITAGSAFGMPSPGHTTLTQLPGGNWSVESFFDITYRIDFVGAPGGPLAGMSGSTTATIRMQQGQAPLSTWSELREPPTFVESMSLAFVITGGTTSCCTGTTGNVDGDPADLVDISDLSAIVDYLFFGGPISPCFEENDVDRSGSIDISDLSLLVDFLFFGATLPLCP